MSNKLFFMIDTKKESNVNDFVSISEASRLSGINRPLITIAAENGYVYRHSQLQYMSGVPNSNRYLVYYPDVLKIKKIFILANKVFGIKKFKPSHKRKS